MARKTEKKEFVNPFSEAFTPIWELWKRYKKEQWGFTYKSVVTEMAAIEHVVELSKGVEAMAILIVKQSMRKGWRGLFEYKNENNGQGNYNQQTSQQAQTRQSVNNYYSQSNRKW